MERASSIATFAASLLFGAASLAATADDVPSDDSRVDGARFAEERLLGFADEASQFAGYQIFTREIVADGIVAQSLDASLAAAGAPAAAMLEARRALATAIDLDREVSAGDRFHVRYEQAFTAEGTPIGVSRVLWAELGTRAKGTIAVYRFRPRGGVERFWFASGEAATPPPVRLPLDIVSVSSGFGMRADPLDKPSGTAMAMGPLPDPTPPRPVESANGSTSAQPSAREEPVKAARRPAVHGPVGAGFAGQLAFGQMGPRATLDIGRLEFEIAEARRAAAARPADVPPAGAAPTEQAAAAPPLRPAPRLFMHDGVDLVASIGTPVYAAADGIVIGAAPNGRYGNWIRIDHPDKRSTVYGHLSRFAPNIEAGVHVSQGELIGFVGNTGRSTGAHLHFELLTDGRAVDPLSQPELKRAQLRGSDLDRFRKQVKRALAERDRESAIASPSSGR